ncbi:MAG: extracellular solute-binding protein [Thermomicrobiales bacterium]
MNHRLDHVGLSRRSFLRGAAGAGAASILSTPSFSIRWASAADTIKVIMIADPWVDTIQTLGVDYEKETGVKVEVESYPYDQTHQKEVLLGTQQSDAADVIVLDSPWVGEFAEAGIVEDLKPRVEATPDLQWDDFIPSYAAVADWNGQIVGIPFAPYYVLLHYRKDLFEAEGLAPPKTFDEWKQIARTFTNNATYPDFYGVAMNNAKGAPVGQAWFEYIWNVGGKPFESNFPGSEDPYADMTPMIASAEGIEVANLFQEMLQYQPEGALNMAWDERVQAFASGKVAMISAWSVRTPLLIDPNRSEVADKFATAVVPARDGITPVPPLGGWVVGINAYSKNADAAWDFIVWLNSPEVHKRFILLGGPPSRISELEDPELVEKFWWFPTLAESAATAYPDCRPRVAESFQIIDTVGNYLSQALSGGISTEDAMQTANDEIKTLLEGAGYNV